MDSKLARENTSIRPRALKRVKLVLPFSRHKSITDFLSAAADDASRPLIEQHNIPLPADAEFEPGENHPFVENNKITNHASRKAD